MLATLPKLADRRFILGFFLPALLLAAALRWMWSGDAAGHWLDLFAEKPTTAVLWILAIWVLGVLLMGFNDLLYRIYAGQIWPLSTMIDSKAQNQKHADEVRKEAEALYNAWIDRELTDAERADYLRLRRELLQWIPVGRDRILPTRFGNAMRASFDYPAAVYGADAVSVWPRMTAVIPKNFADQLDDARCLVDFFMNLSLLSLVACGAGAVTLAANLKVRWFHDATGYNLFVDSSTWVPGIIAVAGGLLTWAAYCWSIRPLLDWGELVRAAFDLYLPALAAGLGFELPPTRAARLQFWSLFSSTATYGADPRGNVDFDPTVWLASRPNRK